MGPCFVRLEAISVGLGANTSRCFISDCPHIVLYRLCSLGHKISDDMLIYHERQSTGGQTGMQAEKIDSDGGSEISMGAAFCFRA